MMKKMLETQKRIPKSLKPPLNQNLSSARPRSEYFIKTNLERNVRKETISTLTSYLNNTDTKEP